MVEQSVCILGGSGYIGGHIIHCLEQDEISVVVPTRRRNRSRHLLTHPSVRLVEADILEPGRLEALFVGVDAVINLVGILNESGHDGSGFRRAHVDVTVAALDACRAAGVRRYLHMSALGADAVNGPSHYQRTKGEAEALVLGEGGRGLDVTVFRPSVVFGPGDNFLNQFASLLRISPGVFPLPTPAALFQPVYVGDVAEAMTGALESSETYGKRYDLVGPRRYRLDELVRYVGQCIGSRTRVIGCSDRFSRLQAAIMGRLPGKPYSMDNYLSSTVDNVSDQDGLAELGIEVTALETVAPSYLAGGRARTYDKLRKRAGR